MSGKNIPLIVAMMAACADTKSAPERNPLMDDDGTHVVTPHLRAVDGDLLQLWTPADWSTHAPEWRPIAHETTEPVVNLSGADGGGGTG